jgi:hypothetical protein
VPHDRPRSGHGGEEKVSETSKGETRSVGLLERERDHKALFVVLDTLKPLPPERQRAILEAAAIFFRVEQ